MAASLANSSTSNDFPLPVHGVISTPDSHVIASIPEVPIVNESQATPVAPSQVASREPTQRWKKAELRLLISLKKDEYEHSLLDTPRDRIKTTDVRWKKVAEGLLWYGFSRKQTLIRKKWEKLTTDFKKIFDFQRRPPSSELGYFEMGSEDRKRFKLPIQYDNEVDTLMECWMPCRRAVKPDSQQILDSSSHGAHSPSTIEAGKHATKEQNTTPPATATTEASQLPMGEKNSENSVPTQPGVKGRLLKQTNRDRLGEHFKNANAEIVKALAMQAEKKTSDKAFLDWEKEKHKFLAQINLKKHKETVTMQETVSGKISSALHEVSTSFMHFATKMSKRM